MNGRDPLQTTNVILSLLSTISLASLCSLYEIFTLSEFLMLGFFHTSFCSGDGPGDIFELLIINLIIIVFTLGLGYAFAEVRTLTTMFSKLQIYGDIDLDAIQQTEAEYKNAFGDEALDVMDLSGVI